VKWVLIVVGAIVLLAVALLALVPYLVDLPRIQAYIADSAGQALGRPVRFGALSLSLWPLPAVVLRDLQVADDPRFGAEPFLRVGEGRFRLGLTPLLSGRVEFAEFTLERPRVRLLQDRAGQWNVAGLGAGAAAASKTGRGAGAAVAVVSRLRIVDGSLSYQSRAGAGPATAYRVDGLNLTVHGLGLNTPIRVQGEARVNPGAVSVKVDGALTLPLGGAGWGAAPVKADVQIEARDLPALAGPFLGPERGVAGAVKGKVALGGTLGRLTLTGEFDAGRLTVTERRPGCPPPGTRQLTLESLRLPLTYDPARLTSRPLSLSLAGGSVALAANLAWEPAPQLSLTEIRIKALPLAPVLVDYLCQGYAVTGPLDFTGELSARPEDPWRTLTGQGQMRIGAGKVVGPAALALLANVTRMAGAISSVLNVDLPLSLFASPLDFQSITATYRIADGRVTTHDFLYTSERMKLAAAGDYGLADGRVNLDVTLSHGRGQIKAKLTGNAASPSIRVVPGTLLRTEPEKIPERLKRFLERLPR
jgi:hypothetical protein